VFLVKVIMARHPPEADTLAVLCLDSKLVVHLDVLEPCMDQLLAIHLLEDGQNTFQLGRSGPTSLPFLQFILDGERLIKEFRGRLLQVLTIKTCLIQTDHPEEVTLAGLYLDSNLVIVFDHVLTNLGTGDLLRLEIPIN
jgi:hypothetical protein